MPTASAARLAAFVWDKVLATLPTHDPSTRTSLHELQLDCDWTDATQSQFLDFLRALRKLAPPSVQLSATIRLHVVVVCGLTSDREQRANACGWSPPEMRELTSFDPGARIRLQRALRVVALAREVQDVATLEQTALSLRYTLRQVRAQPQL